MLAKPRPAKITQEHLDEAKRLKALWTAKEGKPSQAKFGEVYEIGSQGAVWRFLNGRDPLSMKAAMGFAAGLGCDVAAFSPRLAAEAAKVASAAPRAPKKADIPNLLELNPMEAQLVMLFRGLTADQKDTIISKANKLYAASHPARSKANPYPAVPSPIATKGGKHETKTN